MKQYTNGGPLMCTEFWVGWFDHWGNGGHMRGNLEESTKDLDKMLELGHVNIYMFEGGTNFGFMIMMAYLQSLVISQRNIAAIRKLSASMHRFRK